MKIGDYIRTKTGISQCIKVIPIKENSFMYEFDKEVYEDVKFLTTSELEKYKSSPNIIDLIEVGDYVNGVRVNFVYSPDGKQVFRIELDVDGLKGHMICESKHIKSIVTKEQFESMEYRIGE